MFLFDLIVGKLPTSLQPYAKALFPAIATAVGVGVQFVVSGDLNTAELQTAAVGAATALIAFAFPNRKA